jgi:hypothetical protein
MTKLGKIFVKILKNEFTNRESKKNLVIEKHFFLTLISP